MDLTLRQLRYLISLAEVRHFGRAAAAVNVSQPALSVQIRELESALGVRLFERRAREIALTPAGVEVLRRAHRIMRELSELQQAARWRRGLAGRLRLGVIPTAAPYLLPRALPLIRARSPDLDLGVREAQTTTLLSELHEGALDAVVLAIPSDAAAVIEHELFEDRFLLAGSEGRLAALARADLGPEHLDPRALLLLDDGHCLAEQTLLACSLARGQTRTDLAASSLATLCRLAAAGFGLTFVPEIAARSEAASAPGLRLIRFAAPEPLRQIGLVRRAQSVDDGWFGDLAAVLTRAAAAEIAGAREAHPSIAGVLAATSASALDRPAT